MRIITTLAFVASWWAISFACEDGQKNCAQWAGDGECEKNREFMLGGSHYTPRISL